MAALPHLSVGCSARPRAAAAARGPVSPSGQPAAPLRGALLVTRAGARCDTAGLAHRPPVTAAPPSPRALAAPRIAVELWQRRNAAGSGPSGSPAHPPPTCRSRSWLTSPPPSFSRAHPPAAAHPSLPCSSYTGEWEVYRAECSFHQLHMQRTLQIMQQLSREFRGEWHTYTAEAAVAEGAAHLRSPAAEAAEAGTVWRRKKMAKAVVQPAADATPIVGDIFDDAMRPGGCWRSGRMGVARGVVRQLSVAWHQALSGRPICGSHCWVPYVHAVHRPAAQSSPAPCPACPVCPTSLPPSPPHIAGGYHPVTVGERFNDGRYTALYKLGQGHYATVWMVLDSRTGQEVAMKVRLGMCACVPSFYCGALCRKLLRALNACVW